MSELEFSAHDLTHTRFAVSPLWEVVTSMRVLKTPGGHLVNRPWAAQVRDRVHEAGLDRGLLADLLPPWPHYLPDFMTPPPREAFPALADELAVVRAMPAQRVEQDLDKLAAHVAPLEQRSGSSRVRRLRENPAEGLARLAEEIEAYWELAVAPYWSRIRTLLEGEVFHRARQVAEQGAAHVFNDLHPTVKWQGDTLNLAGKRNWFRRENGGSGLLLVPSVFVWPGVVAGIVPGVAPQVIFPARGIGTLWERRPYDHVPAIAAVIGKARALLLTELDAPASTTVLAGRTGMSAGGVSTHLAALRAAGMVSAHRAGRSVLYARTAVADSLLTAG